MTANRFILDRKFKGLIEFIGISVTEVLKMAILPGDLFSRKSIALTTSDYLRLMEAMGKLSIDEYGPIKLGTIENAETFSPPLFAAYCSSNALTFLKRISAYKKLIGPLVLLVDENKDEVTLEITIGGEGIELPEFLVAADLVFLVQLIRNATKTHIVPKEVVTKHKIDNDRYEQFFGIRPIVGSRNIMTFSKEDALRPFTSQNDEMWGYLEPELIKRLSELDVDDTFAAEVRSALMEQLILGKTSIDDVSSTLGCSNRTLQRKLKEENTTFQKQRNHTRELLAKHYLKNTDMSNEDVAYLLGYIDLNSFTRGFQIWTGMTISEYRKNGLSE